MENQFSYQQIMPAVASLKPWIKLYYVHRSVQEDFYQKITYFPNYATTLNIYQGSRLRWDDFSRTHTNDASQAFLQLLVSHFDRSRVMEMQGPFHKLTIVFNTLGINHFLRQPLSALAQRHFAFFDHFGAPFERVLEQVFAVEELTAKRDLLDAFFNDIYLGFTEARLSEAVDQIIDSKGLVTIQAIAQKLKISRKTLLRLFQRHLAYSPSEFKSIVKFRAALNTYQDSRVKPKFSDLAYESDYYDQSDLNFHFKDRTGLTPKQLFAAIQTVAKELHWKIE